MNVEYVWSALLSLITFLGGWVLKDMRDEQVKMGKKIDDLPNIYARRDDVKDSFERLMSAIHNVDTKLDTVILNGR